MSKATKSKRGELPKPIISPLTLGCLPLNPLTVSCLAREHGELILGYRDTTDTMAFKARPTLTVRDGQTSQALSLEGRFFNGYSDALYRGKLPEVLLAAPAPEEWPNFLNDFVEYLEQVLAMGFFLPRKEIIKRDSVTELIPCFILAGGGLLYSRVMTGLLRVMTQLEQEYPVLDENLRLRIMSRFVRGLPGPDEEASLGYEGIDMGRSVDLLDVPRHIRIAGGNRQTQETIQTVLSRYGLIVSVENRVRNSVERLELENALWRVSKIVLPSLAQEIPQAEIQSLTSRVEAGIMAIGHKRQAFEEMEKVESLIPQTSFQSDVKPRAKSGAKSGKTSPAESAKKGASKPALLTRADAEILSGLGLYADALGMTEEKDIFDRLAAQVQPVGGMSA